MKKYTEEQISESLNKTIQTMTPNIFQDIKASLKKKEVNMKKKFLWSFIPATVVIATILVFVGIYYNNNYVTDSLIGIDVNPSIEIEVSKTNKVVEVNALNDGGKKIVDGMDLKKIDLNVALNALIGSMVKYGYLTTDDANILVSVQNDNQTKSTEIKNLVVSIINNSLDDSKVSATIMNQTITTSEKEIEQVAKDNNISYGKALFIKELIKKDSTLNYDTLSTMSLRELAALVESKKIDISDIVEYDDDDSTAELIDDAIEDINEENQINNTNSNLISKEEAKNIAYKHAGISVNDVKNVSIKLDSDDGMKNYDLEFRTSTKKYEYEINAFNGNVIDFETENIKTSTSTSTNYIGESKAKSIAFKHAGINSNQATMVKVVLDNENGIKVYEIEFNVDQYEYSYEINATTGNILDFEKEIDD